MIIHTRTIDILFCMFEGMLGLIIVIFRNLNKLIIILSNNILAYIHDKVGTVGLLLF